MGRAGADNQAGENLVQVRQGKDLFFPKAADFLLETLENCPAAGLPLDQTVEKARIRLYLGLGRSSRNYPIGRVLAGNKILTCTAHHTLTGRC